MSSFKEALEDIDRTIHRARTMNDRAHDNPRILYTEAITMILREILIQMDARRPR